MSETVNYVITLYSLSPPVPGGVRRNLCGNRCCPTGGHKGRPYGHAFGFLVGAGFIPARAAQAAYGSIRFKYWPV